MSKEQNNEFLKNIFENLCSHDMAMMANFLDSFGWYCKKYYYEEFVNIDELVNKNDEFYDLMKIVKKNSYYLRLFLLLSDEYIE